MKSKIELHVHLDGSLNLKHASELLGKPADEVMTVGAGSASLAQYLQCFAEPLKLLQTKENLYVFSQMLAQDLLADGVIYAEVRFCPLLHLEQGLSPHVVIGAVSRGLESVQQIKTNLILCMMRQFTEEQNRSIIDLAVKHRDKVVAVDLAGDEAAYPNEEFKFRSLFQYANQRGIPMTIHGGEAAPASSIDAAIAGNAKRIGHGVRAIESDATIQTLIDRQIAIEVCPTSNLNTGLYQCYGEMPIRALYQHGVYVTINTDNRTVSNTTLETEYDALKRYQGFTDEMLLHCNLYAALSSFNSPEDKLVLCRDLIKSWQCT